MSTQFTGTTEALLNVDAFKARFLHGVDLRDSSGNIMEDIVIQSHLDMAKSMLEHELGCPILATECEDNLDFKSLEYMNWMYLQLNIYPIISVTSINLKWGLDEIILEFPASWHKVWHRTGQVQLLPSLATINSLIFSQIGLVSPMLNRNSYFPQMLQVKYTAGLAADDNHVPAIVNQAIGLMAAINVLNVIGGLGVGPVPGVSNYSLGIDGMTQNIGTSLSVSSHLYSHTCNAYKEMLEKQVLVVLKRMYQRVKLAYL